MISATSITSCFVSFFSLDYEIFLHIIFIRIQLQFVAVPLGEAVMLPKIASYASVPRFFL